MNACRGCARRVAVLWALLVLAPNSGVVADDAELVEPGATIKELASHFVFTEGPACDAAGNIFFSDVRSNRTHKWSLDGELTTFRSNTGGGNGLFFDKHGNLLTCEGGSRRLTAVSPDGKVTVLCDQYEGKKLNSPNDLWIDPRGGVYFTDPRYGRGEPTEQNGFHLYYLPPDGKPLVRVIDNLVKPNGVVGSKDGRLLYVADPGDDKTYVYRIQRDGSLADRKLAASSGSDGMTLDERGNLYLTREAVLVFDTRGNKIATIVTPQRPANVCFGGKDRRTLFITARTSLYSVRMQVQGQ